MTEQIRDLIKHISGYHRLLAARYRSLAAYPSQQERPTLILQYLQERESERANALDKQLQPSEFTGVIDTWLKEKPDEPSPELRDTIEKQLPMKGYTAQQLLRIATEQHNYIAYVYKQIASLSSADSVRDFFTNLAELEDAELRKTISSIDSLNAL